MIQVKKIGGIVSAMFVVAACGALNSALTDAQNRSVLEDVSGTTANDSSTDSANASKPAACHGNPIKDNCATDMTTYCAAEIPADPDPSDKPGSATFEKRHEEEKALLDCLKTNLSSLSASCQEAVNNAPVEKDGGKFGPPPQRAQGQGGPGSNRPRPNCECGGVSPLKDCIADARTLCEAELPVPGENDGFTEEERHQRVDTIIACLEGQLASVSSACQADLAALPSKP